MLQNKKKCDYLIPKHQITSSLSFQFILFEMIKFNKLIKNDLDEILKLVTQFSSCTAESNKYIKMNINNGIFEKIKNYSLQLSIFHSKKNVVKECSENAILICSELLGKISSKSDNLKLLINELLSVFKKLVTTMKKLFPEFERDENVLFFLLRYQNDLEKIFGDKFIMKTFDKFFPESLDCAEKYIKKRYTQRGFSHLKPIISDKIKTLRMRSCQVI